MTNVIENEVSKDYIKLPQDADGFQGTLKDREFIAPNNKTYPLVSLNYSPLGKNWYLQNHEGMPFYAAECRHIQFDPIAKLLKEEIENGKIGEYVEYWWDAPSNNAYIELAEKIHKMVNADD